MKNTAGKSDLDNKLADIAGFDLSMKAQGRCVRCKQELVVGENILTPAGAREAEISGVCETCFDTIFADDEEEGQLI
jgi:hypothetical protein